MSGIPLGWGILRMIDLISFEKKDLFAYKSSKISSLQ